MRVSVVRDPPDTGGTLTMRVDGPHSMLVHETDLGVGVRIGVDVLRPDRWLSLTVDGDATSDALTAALAGPKVRWATGSRLDVDAGGAGPWLRVAAVGAVDRWLQLPLDQAIVNAERAVALEEASVDLTDKATQDIVLGEALRTARRASAGFVAHLRLLGAAQGPIPERLRIGIEHLVDGYGRLAALVSGPDRSLAAVPVAWQAVRARDGGNETSGVVRPRRPRRSRGCGGDSSLIDPRQVPARILALSTDPAAGEVRLAPTADGAGIRIEVPAFGAVDDDTARRLQVRLIDRQTADPVRHGLLTLAATRSATRRFQCTVPARGLDLGRLRADVYDARIVVPPAAADSDAGLRDARRASLFLSEWRRLVAAAQIGKDVGLASGLQKLAGRLGHWSAAPDIAGFPGGPTAAELNDMTGADDVATAGRLRAESEGSGSADGVLGSTSGAGRLLVAEMWSIAEKAC